MDWVTDLSHLQTDCRRYDPRNKAMRSQVTPPLLNAVLFCRVSKAPAKVRILRPTQRLDMQEDQVGRGDETYQLTNLHLASTQHNFHAIANISVFSIGDIRSIGPQESVACPAGYGSLAADSSHESLGLCCHLTSLIAFLVCKHAGPIEVFPAVK